MNMFWQMMVNFLAVFGGLLILWSFVGRMSPGARLAGAAVAGVVSALATVVVTSLVQGAA